jgi:2-desacetyl-2-hydroxyethyl bacteriochlorophyllide A dehydrogenase
MQAIVCREPGELALEERPEPVRGEAEALIGVRRVGLCGTDFHIYEGAHPYLEYPRVIGHEFSGEVLEAPAKSGLKQGQAVVINPYLSCGTCVACRNGKPNCCVRIAVLGVHRDGGCCERLSVPLSNIYPAANLTLDQAASTEFLAIGAHAVARAALKSGARVLVIGAGPIGLGVALFAGIAGADVTILDRDNARAVFAEENDIARRAIVVGADTESLIAELTKGEGFDFVFDATGSRVSIEASFRYVGHGGTLVLVSVVGENITFSDPEFHKREMTIMGSRNATRSDFERVMSAIETNRVPLAKLITHRTSLSGTILDLPRWSTEKVGLVKALVEIG